MVGGESAARAGSIVRGAEASGVSGFDEHPATISKMSKPRKAATDLLFSD